MIEGDTRIISSKDIMSSEFYDIDMKAVDMAGKWGQDIPYRIGYTNLVRQLKRLLFFDIERKKKVDEYKTPTAGIGLTDYDEWEEFHTKLTGLARELGIVGRETAPWGSELLQKLRCVDCGIRLEEENIH